MGQTGLILEPPQTPFQQQMEEQVTGMPHVDLPQVNAPAIDYAQLEQDNDLPAGLMGTIKSLESDPSNPNKVSPKGAQGPFQIMPALQKDLDISDPTNEKEVAPKIAKYIGGLVDKYDGDIGKVLAAYNWGPGNVDKRGLDSAPSETVDYVNNGLKKLGLTPSVSDDDLDALATRHSLTLEIHPKYMAQNDKTNGPMSDADLDGIAKPESLTLDNKLTDDELIKKFGYDPAVIKAVPSYREGMFVHSLTDPNSMMGQLGGTMLGTMIKGAADVPMALEQLGTHIDKAMGISSDAEAQMVDLMAKVAQADYEQNWRHGEPQGIGSKILEGIGSMAVPIPGISAIGGAAAKATGALTRGIGIGAVPAGKVINAVLPSAAEGAAMAPVTSPVVNPSDTGGNTDSYFSEKAGQAEAGAVAAPVTKAAIAPVSGIVSKFGNAKAGIAPANQGAKILQNLGSKFGIPVSYSDISGNAGAKSAMSVLDKLPTLLGGTGKHAEEKSKAITEATQALSARAHDNMINKPFKDVQQIQKIAQTPGAKRQKEAQAVIARVNAAGDDMGRIISASGNMKLLRSKLISDKLYDKVATLAGNGKVWTTETNKALTDIAKELKNIPTPKGEKLLQEVEQMRATMANPKTNNDYAGMRAIRSYFGSEADEAMQRGDKFASGVYSRIKSAVNDDLTKFGTNSRRPDLAAAAKRADTYYRETIVPAQAKELAKLYATGQPDQIFKNFIQTSRGDLANIFYNSLDSKGQAAVRYGMAEEALRKASSTALDPVTGNPVSVDPGKFAKYFRDQQEAKDVFFKGPGKWQIDGLTNLLAHIARSGGHEGEGSSYLMLGALAGEGKLAELTPGAKTGNIHKALMASAGLLGLRALLTTTKGQNWLMAAADAKPGSPTMVKLMETIKVQLPKLSAIVAAEGKNHNLSESGAE